MFAYTIKLAFSSTGNKAEYCRKKKTKLMLSTHRLNGGLIFHVGLPTQLYFIFHKFLEKLII